MREFSRRNWGSRDVVTLCALVALAACKPAPPAAVPHPAAPSPPPATAAPSSTPAAETAPRRVTSSEEVIATWYDLPENSVPARRAPGELTAASDRLPLGSTVRVVNLSNGRSVLVRITDRGVGRRHAIDLCKEAALEIGLVAKGQTKVRVERFDAAEEVPADPRP